VKTPLGHMFMAASSHGLFRVTLPGTSGGEERLWSCAQERFGDHRRLHDPHLLAPYTEWLQAYFARKFKKPPKGLDLQGTPFQLDVWKALCRVRRGRTVTYGELAEQVGRPKAAQAVGQAVGANPLPIFVPCHRVVAARGLGGFAGGLDLKRRLLDHEGVKRVR